MAPPKTMAVSQQEQLQQQQSSIPNNRSDQAAAKPRKRKGNKQQTTNNKTNSSAQNQTSNLVETSKQVSKQQAINNNAKSVSKEDLGIDIKSTTSAKQQQTSSQPRINNSPVKAAAAAVVPPVERVTFKNQVPNKLAIERSISDKGTAIIVAKQLSTEEPDDIDAGIELDGSSNSGSSVKDINEDQTKSASVSPVMAQSNLVENCSTTTKHAIEVAPIGQLAGSLCSDISPASKKASTTTTTKQQLAANQQVIDADEQQLQQKLQIKQRKSSLKGSLNTSAASLNVSATNTNNSNTNASNNVPASPQSPALCKICERHVYQMERIMAEKAVYHKGCFRCHQCKVQLRMDSYSSHEGQVYCKAHHRQLFQPQVKLDNEDDVDIVAKSTFKVVDDYLLQRGRLSELSFSFLKPKPEEIRKRQMIICENEPAELPKDVIRCDTKVDDGIDRLNLNLNNILEKFERGANNGDDSQPSSAGLVIEKPSFDIKKTLMAFETNAVKSDTGDGEDDAGNVQQKPERRVVKKLTNLNGFLNRQSSTESEPSPAANSTPSKPLAVRRSESLMMRLKKYESRINGELVANDDSDDGEQNGDSKQNDISNNSDGTKITNNTRVIPKKLASLKNQWENGHISRRRFDDNDADDEANITNKSELSDSINGRSPSAEKNEELIRVRQQLARKKSGGSASIKNIYENAIKEAQKQKRTHTLDSSDLSALNGFSTIEIQQQLLQNSNKNSQNSSTPSTPNKDHFQLNLSNKANKLKERFEQGLINNSSVDDSDASNGDDEPTMTKLEQLRQEKLEDLSIFAEGEIKAREARSMFQQIDRRLSAASNGSRNSLISSSRSPSTLSASRQQQSNKISTSSIINGRGGGATVAAAAGVSGGNSDPNMNDSINHQQQPIRLTNNVRT